MAPLKRTKQNAFTLAVVTLCVIAQGCKKDAGDADPKALVSVEAERPERGDVSEHILADATLSPLAQASISPRISAPVREFYVQRGSKVKAGQLLAVLENRDLAAQALDNKGQYTAAEASYEIQTQGQVPEDFAKAQLDVAQAKAQLQLQNQIVSSRRQLFTQGAIPGRDLDTAVAQLAQAQTAYDTASNHLNALQRVDRKAQLQQAQGQLSSARGKLQAAEAQVSYSQIHSPISGVVTDRPLFPGETASPGSPLVTVMDTSALLAKVHLAQTVAQQLKLGDAAEVRVPGMADPVPAKVSLISPALDPGSTTVEVWLRVDNGAGTYKAGTPARTSITGRTAHGVLKVPQGAVLTAQDGSKSVMVIQDGAAHKVAVTTGINDGEDVEITRGLSGNETVITTGAYGLDEGTKVQVGKPEAGEKE